MAPRAGSSAPTPEIKAEIEGNISKIEGFAKKVHGGEIAGADGKFENILCIGIGGSALGPEFVSEALGSPKSDKMKVFFLDNTDPDGYDLVFDKLDGKLGRTLAIVTSKSGRNPRAAQRHGRGAGAVGKGGARLRPPRGRHHGDGQQALQLRQGKGIP